MKNESVKKSLEKSKNVPEEKRKIVKRKIWIKNTHTLTINAMNFIHAQLKNCRNWWYKDVENYSIAIRRNQVAYYRNLEEVAWPLGLQWKIAKIGIILRVLFAVANT